VLPIRSALLPLRAAHQYDAVKKWKGCVSLIRIDMIHIVDRQFRYSIGIIVQNNVAKVCETIIFDLQLSKRPSPICQLLTCILPTTILHKYKNDRHEQYKCFITQISLEKNCSFIAFMSEINWANLQTF
jgi:hypothetical protein